ncbi:hypothetical protein [Leucobacter sp. cx-169]|uniref:hypothetical protein n=1 Tax=Leucobacter sp. cx-169 TaxID=2770549 RepID=UPI00165E5735|nr:hypothetical protein [Leucobacter sp. cx-169]MBC9927280.1 hypothetical protein [Leucobacter sp. cx-169]
MAKRKPGETNIREAFEMPAVAENPSSLTVIKQASRKKLLRFAVYVMAFGLVPLCIGIVLIMFTESGSGKGDANASVTSESVNGALGKAAATLAISDWLGQDPQPLPGGTVISWDGFTERDAPAPKTDSEVKVTYAEELHRFTLVDSAGRVFDSQVMVLVDGVRGTKAVGTPTLMPRPANATSEFTGEVPWFGYTNTTAPDPVVTAVQGWAEAFTSGSPKRLKQEVADPTADHAFVPLAGVATVEQKIIASAVLTPAEPDSPAPTQMLARVELMLTWVDAPAQDTTAAAPTLTPVTFDVLITGIDTASPRVVSWGGVGDGPTLKPYSSALVGVSLKEPEKKSADGEPVTPGSAVESAPAAETTKG